MEERYTRLFTLPENLYSCGSPVVVSAGALLKDNKQGDVLVQLKIRNIQIKHIKALTVKIISFDIAGRQLGEETNFQYLDLNVKRDEEFGQKVPIGLLDASARSFSVHVTEVVFEDQTIWMVGNNQWESMVKRKPLNQAIPNHQLASQFRIKYGNQCIDSYQVYQDLWYCSCGALNRKEEAACHSCSLQATTLAEVDLNKLKAELSERLAEEEKLRVEREAREKKRREEEEIRRTAERAEYEKRMAEERAAREKRIKKLRMIVAISASFIMVIIVSAVMITNHKEESARLAEYNEAVTLLDESKYTEAITLFAELGDYRDSAAQLEQAKVEQEEAMYLARYNEAVTLLEEGNYSEAIEIFTELKDYRDSAAQLEQAQAKQEETEYNEAVTLLNEGKYIEAIAKFTELGNYRDSAVQREQAREQQQVAAYEAGRNISAIGHHTMGVCPNGTVVIAGGEDGIGLDYGQCDVSDWNDIVAVDTNHPTVGLRADGTVVAVGKNNHGACDVSGWSDIVAVSAGGWWHTVGLRADGTVVAVGRNDYGECDVSGWSDIVAVSAGNNHTVGLCSDGTVVAVGSNKYGQCNVSDWSDIVAVSSGDYHTVGLRADGSGIE